jgi:hypothetical protein
MDGSLGMDGDRMGNMEDGHMGLKYNFRNVTCFDGRYVSEAQVAQASKLVPSCLLKRDMFQWVIRFEVHVSWCVISNWLK